MMSLKEDTQEDETDDELEDAIEPTSKIITDDEVDELIKSLLSCVRRDAHNRRMVSDVLRDKELIHRLIVRAREMFQTENAFIEITAPINICGDIHGQFADLLRIFEICGRPPYERYLFMGDYVDRGPHSLETICLLLSLKIRYPGKIFLLRGNHECSLVNRTYGFHDECEERFKGGEALWSEFQELFNWLPLVGRVARRILCMHGGLSPELKDIASLRKLRRPIDPCGACLETDLLWSDPDPEMPNGAKDPEYGPSLRGISHHFNKKAVVSVCERMKLDFIARAHQVVQDGYEFFANRLLVTVFSAPNYCGTFNNAGAVMTIDESCRCAFVTLMPLADPPVRVSRNRNEIDIDEALEKALDDL
uniref:Serine/threonine-protein phosphatase n=1 Tax=Ascaris suum TaxID=6253 RepID=F1L9D0_ASCSU